MTRIFGGLAAGSTVVLVIAYGLGWAIGNPADVAPDNQRAVTVHFLFGLASLVFSTLVHAIVLTYFMGTGRWIEEVTTSYRLDQKWLLQGKQLKYRTLPAMVGCLVLLVFTGLTGAIADPAAAIEFRAWAGLSATQWHLTIATITGLANLIVHVVEFRALGLNGALIREVTSVAEEMRRSRAEGQSDRSPTPA